MPSPDTDLDIPRIERIDAIARLHWFDRIDSTNNAAVDRAAESSGETELFLTDNQQAGGGDGQRVVVARWCADVQPADAQAGVVGARCTSDFIGRGPGNISSNGELSAVDANSCEVAQRRLRRPPQGVRDPDRVAGLRARPTGDRCGSQREQRCGWRNRRS